MESILEAVIDAATAISVVMIIRARSLYVIWQDWRMRNQRHPAVAKYAAETASHTAERRRTRMQVALAVAGFMVGQIAGVLALVIVLWSLRSDDPATARDMGLLGLALMLWVFFMIGGRE